MNEYKPNLYADFVYQCLSLRMIIDLQMMKPFINDKHYCAAKRTYSIYMLLKSNILGIKITLKIKML